MSAVETQVVNNTVDVFKSDIDITKNKVLYFTHRKNK